MSTKKPITKDQILDLEDNPDEQDEAFAELIELSQPGPAPGPEDQPDDQDAVESFNDELFEGIAEILTEGNDSELTIADVEFVAGNFVGTYQQGGKKYEFSLTEKDGEWKKEIKSV